MKKRDLLISIALGIVLFSSYQAYSYYTYKGTQKSLLKELLPKYIEQQKQNSATRIYRQKREKVLYNKIEKEIKSRRCKDLGYIYEYKDINLLLSSKTINSLFSIYENKRKVCERKEKISQKNKEIKEKIVQEELTKKRKEVIYNKNLISTIKKRDIRIPKQKKGENTCVIDNLGILVREELGKDLNRKEIYKTLGKKIGDFWNTGIFYIRDEYGGDFIEVESGEYYINEQSKEIISETTYLEKTVKEKRKYSPLKRAKDFKILEEKYHLQTGLSTNIWYFKELLKSNRLLLMEVPMHLLDSRYSEESNVFHAITIIGYNSDLDIVYFGNTLSGKIEEIEFKVLKHSDIYTLYPYRYLTFTDEYNPIIYSK